MPAIEIPDPLPPAITPDREVVEFLIERHLQEFGEDSLVARTWQWILHGGGLGPISHMDYTQFDGDGPPSRATLAAESLASEPPLHPPTPWDDLNRARFICWLCTSQPEDQPPLRFHPWDATPHPSRAKKARSPSPRARSGTPDDASNRRATAVGGTSCSGIRLKR